MTETSYTDADPLRQRTGLCTSWHQDRVLVCSDPRHLQILQSILLSARDAQVSLGPRYPAGSAKGQVKVSLLGLLRLLWQNRHVGSRIPLSQRRHPTRCLYLHPCQRLPCRTPLRYHCHRQMKEKGRFKRRLSWILLSRFLRSAHIIPSPLRSSLG